MSFNMKALQQMQQKMLKLQEDLSNTQFEGTAGGGAVTVQMSGRFELTSVKISKDVVDPEDITMLEDLVLAASQDAFAKVAEAQQQMVSSATGGLRIPGM